VRSTRRTGFAGSIAISNRSVPRGSCGTVEDQAVRSGLAPDDRPPRGGIADAAAAERAGPAMRGLARQIGDIDPIDHRPAGVIVERALAGADVIPARDDDLHVGVADQAARLDARRR